MTHVLALDQGTTSSRAIVFDAEGAVVAIAQREHQQHFPRPGWVEHDALEIEANQRAVAEEAIARAKLAPKDVVAVGITNQRETTVLWDRTTLEPVHGAIVWQDRRTADRCEALKEAGAEKHVAETTGLLLDPYFSATKIAWLLDHVPDLRARAEDGQVAFGTIDTWLAARLTAGEVHATDASNASRTLLYDLRAGAWSDEMCDLFGVPGAVLPHIRASSGVWGEIRTEGPLRGLPIAGVVGDQQGALFGQAAFAPGDAKVTYGTGCFLLMNTGAEPAWSTNRLLSTVAWETPRGRTFALEGSVFIGGAVVQWLRDGLGLIERAEDVEALASSVPDAGGVYVVPAFAGLGAPHWDPRARGTIMGITRGTTAAHIARAALDAVAFQVADLLGAMRADTEHELHDVRVDGGAARNDLLLQTQADLLGIPLTRPVVTETTALGAAFLAGLAAGLWKDEEEVAACWKAERTFEPRMDRDEAAALRARWHEAVERSKGWAHET